MLLTIFTIQLAVKSVFIRTLLQIFVKYSISISILLKDIIYNSILCKLSFICLIM